MHSALTNVYLGGGGGRIPILPFKNIFYKFTAFILRSAILTIFFSYSLVVQSYFI